jgi:hypothetical protein
MRLSRAFLIAGVAFSGILLAANLGNVPAGMHPYISALPLAAAGIGYAVLQVHLRPDLRTLLKRLMLAGTFLLWAVDQLLPAGRLATVIGDVVIGAYVLDLYWLTTEQLSTVDTPGRIRGRAA